MLLNSVILVLREVLEASILISILLAMSLNAGLGLRWMWKGFLLAVLGIYGFATYLDIITDAMDGAGQELANASLQLLVYVLALVSIISHSSLLNHKGNRANFFKWVMVFAVASALTREGLEIYIYVKGFASSDNLRTAVFTGSTLGAGIGISIGVLLFSILRSLPYERSNQLCVSLLIFIAAGMVMQATMLLEQADWIPSGSPIWDSSAILSEQSILGELLYAVFGYEATPSLLQISLYILSFGSMLIASYFSFRIRKTQNAA